MTFVLWILLPEILLNSELASSFLGKSRSPSALQVLLSFAWPVQCKVTPHAYQVVPDSMKSHYLLHSFVAAISGTIQTTIATGIASKLIMKWDLFVFHFFPARNLDFILPWVRAFELWVCRWILGCRRILLLTKNLAPMILIRSTGTPRVSSTNSLCFVPHACIPLRSSVFLASALYPSHMAHATIAVLNLGLEELSWNWILLAVSARCSQINFLHSGHRAGCAIFFPWENHCSSFVKTQVTSHCLHITVMSCSGPSATTSVCCCDATSSVNTSSSGIWIWSRRKKIRPFRLVRSGDFRLLMNSVP